jgi:hypothetical protein
MLLAVAVLVGLASCSCPIGQTPPQCLQCSPSYLPDYPTCTPLPPSSLPFLFSSLKFTFAIDPNTALAWEVIDQDTVRLGIRARTTGYVAVGFAANSVMVGTKGIALGYNLPHLKF